MKFVIWTLHDQTVYQCEYRVAEITYKLRTGDKSRDWLELMRKYQALREHSYTAAEFEAIEPGVHKVSMCCGGCGHEYTALVQFEVEEYLVRLCSSCLHKMTEILWIEANNG